MSKSRPIWGVDVAHWQQSIDMRRVKHEGYDFVVAKATEGPSRDGSKYTDDRYRQHMRNAQAADLIVGAYYFLVETLAKRQVDHFLSTVGDVRGKIIIVNFEPYNPHEELTPSNNTLKEFVQELRHRIGDHPIMIYASRGFRNGGKPTGPAKQFDDVGRPLSHDGPRHTRGVLRQEQEPRVGQAVGRSGTDDLAVYAGGKRGRPQRRRERLPGYGGRIAGPRRTGRRTSGARQGLSDDAPAAPRQHFSLSGRPWGAPPGFGVRPAQALRARASRSANKGGP